MVKQYNSLELTRMNGANHTIYYLNQGTASYWLTNTLKWKV